MKYLTIPQIAEKKQTDRSTVLRWVKRNLFPNAELKESPIGSYWIIPETDLSNFILPRRGRPRKTNNG
ncbi:MAG: helix-turn-helix domain-containing protein [Aridibacter sp.]|jgi:hypothetical protein